MEQPGATRVPNKASTNQKHPDPSPGWPPYPKEPATSPPGPSPGASMPHSQSAPPLAALTTHAAATQMDPFSFQLPQGQQPDVGVGDGQQSSGFGGIWKAKVAQDTSEAMEDEAEHSKPKSCSNRAKQQEGCTPTHPQLDHAASPEDIQDNAATQRHGSQSPSQPNKKWLKAKHNGTTAGEELSSPINGAPQQETLQTQQSLNQSDQTESLASLLKDIKVNRTPSPQLASAHQPASQLPPYGPRNSQPQGHQDIPAQQHPHLQPQHPASWQPHLPSLPLLQQQFQDSSHVMQHAVQRAGQLSQPLEATRTTHLCAGDSSPILQQMQSYLAASQGGAFNVLAMQLFLQQQQQQQHLLGIVDHTSSAKEPYPAIQGAPPDLIGTYYQASKGALQPSGKAGEAGIDTRAPAATAGPSAMQRGTAFALLQEPGFGSSGSKGRVDTGDGRALNSCPSLAPNQQGGRLESYPDAAHMNQAAYMQETVGWQVAGPQMQYQGNAWTAGLAGNRAQSGLCSAADVAANQAGQVQLSDPVLQGVMESTSALKLAVGQMTAQFGAAVDRLAQSITTVVSQSLIQQEASKQQFQQQQAIIESLTDKVNHLAQQQQQQQQQQAELAISIKSKDASTQVQAQEYDAQNSPVHSNQQPNSNQPPHSSPVSTPVSDDNDPGQTYVPPPRRLDSLPPPRDVPRNPKGNMERFQETQSVLKKALRTTKRNKWPIDESQSQYLEHELKDHMYSIASFADQEVIEKLQFVELLREFINHPKNLVKQAAAATLNTYLFIQAQEKLGLEVPEPPQHLGDLAQVWKNAMEMHASSQPKVAKDKKGPKKAKAKKDQNAS